MFQVEICSQPLEICKTVCIWQNQAVFLICILAIFFKNDVDALVNFNGIFSKNCYFRNTESSWSICDARKFTLTPFSVQFPNFNLLWYKTVVPEWYQKNEYYSFSIYANSKKITRENHRGSQLYFHITRYLLKEGRTHFWLPKVKVGFRHLFSLQKRFSLCSSHKINANIVVFCWLTGLQWNNTRF